MANRRMISKRIIEQDEFLDMPISSQCLYFHLIMRADDEGFVGNPRAISRLIGCSLDDLKLLITKNYIIPFESGVCVITNWLEHNNIRKDRFTETIFKDEKFLFEIKDKKYMLKIQS